MSKLHDCKRGLSTATPSDYNRWWRRIKELEAKVEQWHLDALKYSGLYTESLATIKELKAENKRLQRKSNHYLVSTSKLEARLLAVREAHDDWKRTEDDEAADECFADKVLGIALGEKK